MTARMVSLLAMLALPACGWRDRVNLVAIKRRMTENLAGIPNYACLETIIRSRSLPPSLAVAANGKHLPFRRVDVLRL